MSSSHEDPFDLLGSPEPTSRLEFSRAMDLCDERLVELGDLVASAIAPMTEAFLSGDGLSAEQLIRADAEVDRAGLELEERCFVLIARQSPVAADLRRMVGVIHCVNDVVRSGDLLRHVGESLKWIHPPSMGEKLRAHVRDLGEMTQQLFERGLQAWADRDGLAINELERADDGVDLLQKLLLTDLYTGDQSVEEAVSLALVARYYERIADHGVEIAGQAALVATGERGP